MKMRAVIRGIHEDAWTAVETGWSAPTALGEDGSQVPKDKLLWTDDEKSLAKYNARAISAIFNAVNEKQFERIQCCESAKVAWDKLKQAYEGTLNVKRSRIDMLATRFENLRMGESETVEEFSGKLSSIANEAQNMGKKYKDKKLVKKLLRSLPPKFESKKTAMGTALDTDNMDLDEIVGHLQAYEMEIAPTLGSSSKGIAFVA
ncbi:unnamed protein product [Microthlaspi erraticum]|uniref:Uncharacterized protein n=1 Tax=Microthlaspi erraticum TaxID=1685480 RepID=A0A6D2IFW9_9BRAS|nr:unnamed protein product [Microthlaspi erraticum]